MIPGEKVNLRLITEEDLDAIYVARSNMAERGEFWHVEFRTAAALKKKYADTGYWTDDFGMMLITDKSGRLIGDITFFKGGFYLPGYEIGYQLYRREDRGKGYTTEALRIFAGYLFSWKPIARLEIHAAVGNTGSRRVAEKAGFKYEGLKRKAGFNRGRYEDMEMFSLIREECQDLIALFQ